MSNNGFEPPKCPITYDFMKDPVIDEYGQTYEREAITKWMQQHNTSPVTNLQYNNFTLIPNYSIKQLTQEYLANYLNSNPKLNNNNNNTNIKMFTEPSFILNSNNIIQNDGTNYLCIEVQEITSKETVIERRGKVIICDVDVSGSMGEPATEYKRDQENQPYTRLDLVKHTLTTILESLSTNDMMAIVSFNNSAKILQSLIPINTNTKLIIKNCIDQLQAGGGTNIWSGLKSCIDIANTVNNLNIDVSILLLTDGFDNDSPPRGVMTTFQSYKLCRPININTFAYGYNVDSSLISQIAELGQGIYGYIPDGSMVGTIFINALSNILSTCSTNINISVQSNYRFKHPDTNIITNNTTINLGTICYGGKKHILLELIDKPTEEGVTNIVLEGNNKHLDNLLIGSTSTSLDLNIGFTLAKYIVIKRITRIIELFNNKIVPELLNDIKTIYTQYPIHFIKDLLEDIEHSDVNKGQIGKAGGNYNYYIIWGQHYLRSLLSSYKMELTYNFKDQAPQHFKTDYFKYYQNEIEKIFLSIEAPKPTLLDIYMKKGLVTNATAYASGTLNQSFYNVSGGCFTGGWLVHMANGTQLPVSSIKAGYKVISLNSPTGVATVKCVLKFRINNYLEMTSLDGKNGITFYHPFYISNTVMNNEWQYPCNFTGAIHGTKIGDYMYDFVLDCGHTILCNDKYNFACLGHGITTSPVIKHKYFGTKKIIDDLMKHPDYKFGYMYINNWEFIRDFKTNEVDGLLILD